MLNNDNFLSALPVFPPRQMAPVVTTEAILTGLYALAVGDALGTPLEERDRRYVLSVSDRFNGFMDPYLNEYIKEKGLLPGVTSDDTIFTCTVGEALIIAGRFDMDSMVQTHLDIFRFAPRVGWGPQVIAALSKLDVGGSLSECGQINNASMRTGNGALMKLFFLGLYHELTKASDETMLDDAEKLTVMTHRSSVGVQASIAYLGLLRECAHNDIQTFDVTKTLERVVDLARRAEARLMQYKTETQPSIASRIEAMAADFSKFEDPDNYLMELGTPDSNVLNCFPAVLRTVLLAAKRDWNVFKAITETIELGGDTDSNAAMVAGCIGVLRKDTNELPKSLLEKLQGKDELADIATRFSKRFINPLATKV